MQSDMIGTMATTSKMPYHVQIYLSYACCDDIVPDCVHVLLDHLRHAGFSVFARPIYHTRPVIRQWEVKRQQAQLQKKKIIQQREKKIEQLQNLRVKRMVRKRTRMLRNQYNPACLSDEQLAAADKVYMDASVAQAIESRVNVESKALDLLAQLREVDFPEENSQTLPR